MKDILKKCKSSKHVLTYANYTNVGTEESPEYVAVKSYDELEQERDETEDTRAISEMERVLHKMHLHAIYSKLGTGLFTESEEAILFYMNENPDITVNALAKALKIHHEIMKRMLKRFRTKLKSLGLDWDDTIF
ncbi:MarR family transcriptional regulator [Ruminiclostridium hungatei]|uniref:MarR family transcriptional regulator n=1 Tax=Ruminiclostridium hungatei TaxID=48256 RepID=UPI0010554076|nr:MarR family transcriptional regulator [Ruminiclostridium hungatei]